MWSLLIISFLASVVGAICGIGGGVIIKPIMDMLRISDTTTINFLSGWTVLAMSSYSVLHRKLSKQNSKMPVVGKSLAYGAACGGIIGKMAFHALVSAFCSTAVGQIQTVVLLILSIGILVYTTFRKRIKTHCIRSVPIAALVGMILGVFSAFLGIGGGPINIIVFSYLFSMDSKQAAECSLYVIMVSQATSLLFTLLGNSIPTCSFALLATIAAAGIAGGIVGRRVNMSIDENAISRLFLGVNCLIICICLRNLLYT